MSRPQPPALLPPLPRVPGYALDREFLLDQSNEDVTSIDVAPHGGFCIIGCSNGAVLLFDMTNLTNQRNGYLLAHIRPKGMHTSLRLTVKISEDSRFCFVGVRKGSSDMIAIDLGKFDAAWDQFPSLPAFGRVKKQAMTSNAELVLPVFDVYAHNDPKLRGFGTATGVPIPEGSTAFAPGASRFWLACGMGIKNVHVWQLTITPPSVVPASPSTDGPVVEAFKRDTWTCIFDVATNGSSINHLGFRNQGFELLTKCDNISIRVWDLSQYDVDPALKPAYEDIPNSADVKCLMEQTQFTFGGAYEFAVVKVDKNTPKEANRNVFDLPDKANAGVGSGADDEASASNMRRRRATREISDVIGTQDGMHAVILCSDGFTMHFYRQNQVPGELEVSTPTSPKENTSRDALGEGEKLEMEEEEGDGFDTGQLQDLHSLVIDMDNRDQCWALRRVGAEGHVLLLRVIRPPGFNNKGTGTPRKAAVGTISVTRLSSMVGKETSLAFANTAASWQALYGCHVPIEPIGPIGIALADSVLSVTIPPAVCPGTTTPLPAAKVIADPQRTTPAAPKLPPKAGDKKRKLDSTPKPDLFSTPSASRMTSLASPVVVARKTPRISPLDKGYTASTPSSPATSVVSAVSAVPRMAKDEFVTRPSSGGIAMSRFEFEDSPKKSLRPLAIGPPPTLARRPDSITIKDSPVLVWTDTACTVKSRALALLSEWKEEVGLALDRCQERARGRAVQALAPHIQQSTVSALSQVVRILKSAVHEVERLVNANVAHDKLVDLASYKLARRSPADGVLAAIGRHRSGLTDTVLPRLRVDLNAAAARDAVFAQLVLPSGKAVEVPSRLLRDCMQDFEDAVEAAQALTCRIADSTQSLLEAAPSRGV